MSTEFDVLTRLGLFDTKKRILWLLQSVPVALNFFSLLNRLHCSTSVIYKLDCRSCEVMSAGKRVLAVNSVCARLQQCGVCLCRSRKHLCGSLPFTGVCIVALKERCSSLSSGSFDTFNVELTRIAHNFRGSNRQGATSFHLADRRFMVLL